MPCNLLQCIVLCFFFSFCHLNYFNISIGTRLFLFFVAFICLTFFTRFTQSSSTIHFNIIFIIHSGTCCFFATKCLLALFVVVVTLMEQGYWELFISVVFVVSMCVCSCSFFLVPLCPQSGVNSFVLNDE